VAINFDFVPEDGVAVSRLLRSLLTICELVLKRQNPWLCSADWEGDGVKCTGHHLLEIRWRLLRVACVNRNTKGRAATLSKHRLSRGGCLIETENVRWERDPLSPKYAEFLYCQSAGKAQANGLSPSIGARSSGLCQNTITTSRSRLSATLCKSTRAKVHGSDKFADDIVLPRMLFCKILRTHVPHGLIKSIDVSKLSRCPACSLSLPEKPPIPYGILPVSQDEHALCIDKVRFIGDPVAAVAAIDEDVAFDAMNLIEVEYERLNTISSIEEAVMIDEPRIHEYGDAATFTKKSLGIR